MASSTKRLLLPWLILAGLTAVGFGLYRHMQPSVGSASAGLVPAAPAPQPDAARAPAADTRRSPRTRDDLAAELRAKLRAGVPLSEVVDELRALAQEQPQLAADLAIAIAMDAAQRYVLVSAVLDTWARADRDAAWRWSLAHARDADRPGERTLTAVVLASAAASDAPGTIGFVEDRLTADDGDLPRAELVRELVEALLGQQQLDLAAQTITRWAHTDLGTELGNAALERIAQELAARSPEEAADWLGHLPATPERTQAIATFAAARAQADPVGAMNWAAALDSGAGRNEAMQRVFNRWAQSDVMAAAQWLADHESQPNADRLIANLIETAALPETDPALALRWAELIADPDQQTRETRTIILTWAAKDAPAARAYVNANSAFTAAQRTALLEAMAPLANVR